MKTPRSPGAGIPRLQELSFLEVAAKRIQQGETFDQIRRGLVDHMTSLRQTDTPVGNTAIMRLARHNPHRYFSNTVEALAELMRLGLVEKIAIPSTKSAAAFYQQQTYTLTADGESWVALLDGNASWVQEAYNSLLCDLWRCHPQFRGYLRLLGQAMFVVPTANWSEAQKENAGLDERRAYIAFLAARAARAVQAGVTGWNATEAEIADAIHTYIEERIAGANRRHRPNPYPRSRDFIGACEEALVSLAFRRADLRLDYISHEILRRWTKDLAVANFSYHVPGAPALRLWSTAEIEEKGGVPHAHRRSLANWGDRIIDELPQAYRRAQEDEPGNSWIPIYRVRAAVCSRLGVIDPIFDRAIQQFQAGERRNDAPFRVNLDPAQIGTIPPSEQPLKIVDPSGRLRTYRVMTLYPVSERKLA